MTNINPYIFRKNGIRGVAGDDLTPEVCRRIGLCCARLLGNPVILGRDQRLSSPELAEALCDGLRAAGIDIIDIGIATRGTAGRAGWKDGIDVAYISASHLPAEWNGVKLAHGSGIPFNADETIVIRDAVLSDEDPAADTQGTYTTKDVREEYLQFLQEKIPPAAAPIRVLADCGNGTASISAPEILSRLGYEVTPLFDTLDGNFPNRESEIDEETLQPTLPHVEGHDLGIAFDGDADRMTLLTPGGRILDAEEASFVILNELLKNRRGDIVANVGCGTTIDFIAGKYGRKVERVPIGAVSMLTKMEEIGASFGLESSMHMCIPHILPFDDAVAVGAFAAYAVSVLRKQGRAIEDLLAEIPPRARLKKNYEMDDAVKFELMDRIRAYCLKEYENVGTVDGVRMDFGDRWALVRQSDTSPMIRVMVEADTEQDARELLETFARLVEEGPPS